jgi:hypothetical protein
MGIVGIDVAGNPSGVPDYDAIGWYVAGYYSTSSNHRMLTYGYTRQDGRICTDTGTFTDNGTGVLARTLATTWKRIIRERGVWSDEDIILNRYTVPQLNTRFYRYAVTDSHIIFDEYIRAKVAIATNNSTRHNDAELPYASVVANMGALYI